MVKVAIATKVRDCFEIRVTRFASHPMGCGIPTLGWSASWPRRPGLSSSPTHGPSSARPSMTSASPRTRARQSRSSRRDRFSVGWCPGGTTRFRQSAVASPSGTARWLTWVPAAGCARARSWGWVSTTSISTRDGCTSRVRSSSFAPGSSSACPRMTGTAWCRCRLGRPGAAAAHEGMRPGDAHPAVGEPGRRRAGHCAAAVRHYAAGCDQPAHLRQEELATRRAGAGIEPTLSTGMHALRHFYASSLLDAGERIKRSRRTSVTLTPASRSGSTRI